MASTPAPAIEGMRGILVHVGLGNPMSRAFVAGTAVGLLAYGLKIPGSAFDDDGNMKPLALVSQAPNATNAHFLAVPIGAATLAYLFT